MKTNSAKKIIVSTLALAMGAGLAGSISGSVAWYQYSTRTTAQLQGVSAGATRNLRLRIAGSNAWSQDLTTEMINAYLGIDANDANKPNELKLNPVTIAAAAHDLNSALTTRQETVNQQQVTVPDFRGHPVYQYGDLPTVGKTHGSGANTSFNYIQIPLEFDLVDNGSERIEKDIYLVTANFLDLSEEDANHNDITPALRVHFASGDGNYNCLLSKSNTLTSVSGALDLNNDGNLDRDGFGATGGNIINYGNKNVAVDAENAILKQESWTTSGESSLLANDTNAYTFTNKNSLGETTEDGDYLKITLTIWLEGWTELPAPTAQNANATSNLWDLKFSGSSFGIQLRFACEADA